MSSYVHVAVAQSHLYLPEMREAIDVWDKTRLTCAAIQLPGLTSTFSAAPAELYAQAHNATRRFGTPPGVTSEPHVGRRGESDAGSLRNRCAASSEVTAMGI